MEQLLTLKAAGPQMKQEISRIQTAIPPTADLPGLTNFLQLAAGRAGVQTVTLTYGQPGLSAQFSIIPVSITVEGNFFQLDGYLFRLERLPRAVKVTAVGISQAAYPSLSMTVTAEAYTSDTEAGPGSTPGHQAPGTIASTEAPAAPVAGT